MAWNLVLFPMSVQAMERLGRKHFGSGGFIAIGSMLVPFGRNERPSAQSTLWHLALSAVFLNSHGDRKGGAFVLGHTCRSAAAATDGRIRLLANLRNA